MPTAQTFIKELEGAFKDSGVTHPHVQFWFNELKDIVNDNIPELAHVRVGNVYLFEARGKKVRAVVTKSNTKTWVLYETTDSTRPGCRWMLGKSWCTIENLKLDTAQSYILPEHVVIK